MRNIAISNEQRELFNNSVASLCATLREKGQKDTDVVPDMIYLDKDGGWTVYSRKPRRKLHSLEEILLAFSRYRGCGNKLEDELFDILIKFMKIDEDCLVAFPDPCEGEVYD